MAFFRSGGFRILIVLFVLALIGGAVGGVAFYLTFLRDLPDLRNIEDYRPPVVTQVLDRKGRPIAEFYTERRRLVTMDALPEHAPLAFVAAEDGGFFEHQGVDYVSIVRAALANLRAGGKKEQGASTITQQTVKGLLLSPEKTYRRKIREIFLARQLELEFSKQEILFLYLNQIYFGSGAWGIGDAANTYFGKPASELSVSESALLAGLPQRPTAYSPFRSPKAAEARRRYVLGRMFDEGFIEQAAYDEALASPPLLAETKPGEADFEASAYFTELVRRYLFDRIGGERVLNDGLVIHTTLDLDLQRAAVVSVRGGLEAHDKRQGWRGPEREISREEIDAEVALLGDVNEIAAVEADVADADSLDPDAAPEDEPGAEGEADEESESAVAAAADSLVPVIPIVLPDVGDTLTGIVLSVDRKQDTARVALGAGLEGSVTLEDVKWARPYDPERRRYDMSDIEAILAVGDVAKFERLSDPEGEGDAKASEKVAAATSDDEVAALALPTLRLGLAQKPLAQGALLSLENTTGDVLALVGGYDYQESEFDRVTQGRRQPGSSFKPFIYGAAISRGYTPVSEVIDRPIVREDPVSGFVYKPRNYGRKFYGPISLRRALAKSVNNATVHLFVDVGVDYVIDYARRLGIESPLTRDLSLALGTSSVTLLELVRAYAVFPNGGRRVVPRFITGVVDRDGNELLSDVPLGNPPAPVLRELDPPSERPALRNASTGSLPFEEDPGYPDADIAPNDQIIPRADAFLMADMLTAVVTEGTGRGTRRVGSPIGGKTGTTNDQYDAWFVGFSRDVTTGTWVGHDQARVLGVGETGGRTALPIWRDYMDVALDYYRPRAFEQPQGIVYARIDPETGLLANSSQKGAYFQAFLDGTEPTVTTRERTDAAQAARALRNDLF